LLVDPTITHGFPLWSGYGNFHPPPSINTPLDEITFPPYGTTVQEFIFWTLNRANSTPSTPLPSPDLFPLAFFTMICAQWILMCEYINARLGQIEWEIELGLSNLYAQDFDHTLKTLLMWRRRMPIYHSFVERSISRLTTRYKSDETTTTSGSWGDVLVNLKDILHRIEILHCRADKIMAVSMAVTAREESKKATQESHAITRVSYLAFVFVPLSFWASFFSMSGDFPVRTYWIYAAIAVPITACVLGVLVFASRVGTWWRTVKEDRRKRWARREKIFKGGV
jgi:Mg2+ and Co2+ transporter CorA